ncbi:hypothetical protein BD309DRAFT_498791 [Dichomitus squalens]|uniref:Uncharacterized protein n=1 Tax=Dichomitus squalens TaxID=114155 RepID=A0A4Q9P6Y7_9APHY|nr:hypothetical protein BD309DRAFT_498791 [Dichomitus squalens]TBU65397.1 hypothetical protein BD310DRAFT_6562 [Dichomitus squalens]
MPIARARVPSGRTLLTGVGVGAHCPRSGRTERLVHHRDPSAASAEESAASRLPRRTRSRDARGFPCTFGPVELLGRGSNWRSESEERRVVGTRFVSGHGRARRRQKGTVDKGGMTETDTSTGRENVE